MSSFLDLLLYMEDKILSEKAANLYKRHWDKDLNLWVYDHRDKLGLSPNNQEIVHHKNGNHKDNSEENLEPLSRADHARVERPALKHETCKICGEKHYAEHLCQKHYMRKYRKALKKKLTSKR